MKNLLWTIWWKALTLCFLNHFPSCCWVVCEILSVRTTSPHISIPRCRVMCDAKCTKLGRSEGCPVKQRHWIRKFLTCSAVSSRRRVKRSAFKNVCACPEEPQLIYKEKDFALLIILQHNKHWFFMSSLILAQINIRQKCQEKLQLAISSQRPLTPHFDLI